MDKDYFIFSKVSCSIFLSQRKLGNAQKYWPKMAIFWIFGSKSAITLAKIDGFSNFLALNISKLYGQDDQTD